MRKLPDVVAEGDELPALFILSDVSGVGLDLAEEEEECLFSGDLSLDLFFSLTGDLSDEHFLSRCGDLVEFLLFSELFDRRRSKDFERRLSGVLDRRRSGVLDRRLSGDRVLLLSDFLSGDLPGLLGLGFQSLENLRKWEVY